MGIDYHAYLGPYLEVHSDRTIEKVDACGHDVPKDDDFCGTCGRKQSDRYEHKVIPSKVDEIYDDITARTETLRMVKLDEGCVMVPNIAFGLKRETHFDPKYETGIVEMGTGELEGELLIFKRAFKEEIARFREADPEAAVRWGLVMWMS